MLSLDGGDLLTAKFSLNLASEEKSEDNSYGYNVTSLSHNQKFVALVKKNSIVEIRNASDFSVLNRVLPLQPMNFSKIIPFDKSSFILLDNNGKLFHVDQSTCEFEALPMEKIENIFPVSNKGCLIKQTEHFISELKFENKKAVAEFKFKAETNALVASETKNIVVWSEEMVLQLKAFSSNETLGFVDLSNYSLKNNAIDEILILHGDCICCKDLHGNIYFIDTLTSVVLNQFSFDQKKSLKIAYSKFTKQVYVANEFDNLHICKLNENLQWTVQDVTGCSLQNVQALICSPVSLFAIRYEGTISVAELNSKSNALNFNQISNSSVNSIVFSDSLGAFVAFDNKIQIHSQTANSATLLTHEIKYKQCNFLIKDISARGNNLIVIYQKGAIIYKIDDAISKIGFIELNCPVSIKQSSSNTYINDGRSRIVRIEMHKLKENDASPLNIHLQKPISDFSVSCCDSFISTRFDDGSVSLFQIYNNDGHGLELSEIKLPKINLDFSATLFSQNQPKMLYLFSDHHKKVLIFNIETRNLAEVSFSNALNTKFSNHVKFNNLALYNDKILLATSRFGYLTVNIDEKQANFKHHLHTTNYYAISCHNSSLVQIKMEPSDKTKKISNSRSKVFKYGY